MGSDVNVCGAADTEGEADVEADPDPDGDVEADPDPDGDVEADPDPEAAAAEAAAELIDNALDASVALAYSAVEDAASARTPIKLSSVLPVLTITSPTSAVEPLA
jgi:hypothetical protein